MPFFFKGGEKVLKKKSSQAGGKIVEMLEFEESEVERLELLKGYFGLKQNKEAIKALIAEKCAAIKLAKEQERNRRIEEAKDLELLGEYTPPESD
jgi:hypothetical protein